MHSCMCTNRERRPTRPHAQHHGCGCIDKSEWPRGGNIPPFLQLVYIVMYFLVYGWRPGPLLWSGSPPVQHIPALVALEEVEEQSLSLWWQHAGLQRHSFSWCPLGTSFKTSTHNCRVQEGTGRTTPYVKKEHKLFRDLGWRAKL